MEKLVEQFKVIAKQRDFFKVCKWFKRKVIIIKQLSFKVMLKRIYLCSCLTLENSPRDKKKEKKKKS